MFEKTDVYYTNSNNNKDITFIESFVPFAEQTSLKMILIYDFSAF